MAQDQNSNFQSFLGTGWSFPPSFNKEARIIEMVSGEKDIEQSIEIILSTNLGERVMQPRFGCNLRDYVFESLDASLLNYLVDLVKTAILLYEPRVDINNIRVDRSENGQNGQILITVDYNIRGTNTRYNLVYPYYLNEATVNY